MRHRLGLSLVFALTLVAVLAPRAGADARQRKAAPSPRARAQVVTVSGRCSGPIGSEMRVGGTAYRVAPDVRIYEIGRGVVPGGTPYFDRVVTVSGIQVRSTFIVQSVVVRPDTWPSSAGGVGIEPETGPK